MKKVSDKIQRLRKEYQHPEDVEYLKDIEDRAINATRRAKYYDLEATKDVVVYLKERLKSLKLKLVTEVGMEREDNLALHGRRQEIEDLLGFFAKDPVAEIEQIEKEVDSYIGG